MSSAIIGFVAALAVVGLYQLIRTSWPRLYFGPEDAFGALISSSIWFYVTFRAIPVIVTTVFFGTYASRWPGSNIWTFAVVLTLSYIAISSALKIGNRRTYNRKLSPSDLGWLTASALIVTLSVPAGVLLIPLADKVLPDASSISEAIITALFVAALALIGRSLELNSNQMDEVVKKALRRSREDLSRIEAQCLELSIPPEPLIAIYLAESIQRPPWFRRLESGMSRLGLARTIGPFQVPRTPVGASTVHPIGVSNYLERNPAIHLILAERRSAAVERDSSEWDAVYALHNPSNRFVDFCKFIASTLEPDYLEHTYRPNGADLWVDFSSLLISGGSVSVWLQAMDWPGDGPLRITPAGSGTPMIWEHDERDARRYSAPPEEFFKPWLISYDESTEEDREGPGKIEVRWTFNVQEHVASRPRWD
ncbi:hypothetical protein [Brachybacterium phenoliresistens]|uniref:hypothetical protein n=1 Tax=Brachybacterium phenoliresistens TaxID=396014 RepID=UPI0031CF228D